MKRAKRWVYWGESIQNRRSSNMDSLLLREAVYGDVPIILAVVCDGVGSLQDGAFASSETVKQLSKWFDEIHDTKRIGMRLLDRVSLINNDIVNQSQERGIDTASTLSAILIDGDKFYIVHVGDSRIYAFKADCLEQLTVDQVKDGVLVSYIGRKPQTEVFYREGNVDGCSFLLCSDGLYKKLLESEISSELHGITKRRMKTIVSNLLEKAVRNGETDNISIAVVHYE